MKVVRVFPRRTKQTPSDELAFVGEPPMFLPEADEVHVSCCFTWDREKAKHLAQAWGQYYPVKLGGVAMGSYSNGFVPGRYVRDGVTFTSRGCNNHCPYCLVPEREGKLREIEIVAGNTVQDNNLLQCSRQHRGKVFDMLRRQYRVNLAGGLECSLLTDEIADEIRSLRIWQIFLAADTKGSLKHLEVAIKRLQLPKYKVRCFALLAYNGETISEAMERLLTIWELGAMPFPQLYQPPDEYIHYSTAWHKVARDWGRPAVTKAVVRDMRFGTSHKVG